MSRYVTLEEFSTLYGVETRLVREFIDFGLIQTSLQHDAECLSASDLSHAERLIRLYQDLGINKEGIEIILSMREQITGLRKEVLRLTYKTQHLEQEQQQKLIDIPLQYGLLIDYND